MTSPLANPPNLMGRFRGARGRSGAIKMVRHAPFDGGIMAITIRFATKLLRNGVVMVFLKIHSQKNQKSECYLCIVPVINWQFRGKRAEMVQFLSVFGWLPKEEMLDPKGYQRG